MPRKSRIASSVALIITRYFSLLPQPSWWSGGRYVYKETRTKIERTETQIMEWFTHSSSLQRQADFMKRLHFLLHSLILLFIFNYFTGKKRVAGTSVQMMILLCVLVDFLSHTCATSHSRPHHHSLASNYNKKLLARSIFYMLLSSAICMIKTLQK